MLNKRHGIFKNIISLPWQETGLHPEQNVILNWILPRMENVGNAESPRWAHDCDDEEQKLNLHRHHGRMISIHLDLAQKKHPEARNSLRTPNVQQAFSVCVKVRACELLSEVLEEYALLQLYLLCKYNIIKGSYSLVILLSRGFHVGPLLCGWKLFFWAALSEHGGACHFGPLPSLPWPLGHVRQSSYLVLVCAALLFYSTC